MNGSLRRDRVGLPRKSTTVLLCALLLALIGAETLAGEADHAPRRGGILPWAVEGEPPSLDPLQLPSNDAATLAFLVFHSLLELDSSGQFIPVLTERLPDVSPDSLTYTFRLRKGVRFSNGRELSADDVVFTFERGCDPTAISSSSAFYRNIEGSAEFGEARLREIKERRQGGEIPAAERHLKPLHVTGLTAPDSHTFQLRLKSPDLAAIASIAGVGIVPRQEFFRPGLLFGTHPIGTGAFMLKEWRRGVRMRFERNPHCFRVAETYLDGIEVLLNIPTSTQAMLFDRNETGLLTIFADVDAWRWKRNPTMQDSLVIFPGASPSYIALNCEMPPFTNRLVRQAMNYAVNKEAIVKKLLHRAEPAQGPLPRIARGFNPHLADGARFPWDPSTRRLRMNRRRPSISF